MVILFQHTGHQSPYVAGQYPEPKKIVAHSHDIQLQYRDGCRETRNVRNRIRNVFRIESRFNDSPTIRLQCS